MTTPTPRTSQTPTRAPRIEFDVCSGPSLPRAERLAPQNSAPANSDEAAQPPRAIAAE